MRLARIPDLINKDRVQRQFESEVVADTAPEIDRKVNEIIDWLVSADLNQWQAVTDYLEQRKEEHRSRIVGNVGKGFQYDRESLIDSVGRTAHRVVETYDKSGEAEAIAMKAQQAVMQSAGLQIGGIGLGAVIVALTTTAAIDITGVLMGGTVAVLGLFIIPARRRKAQEELSEKIADLRTQLMDALDEQFERELKRSIERINEAIAPYTRFVRAERTRLQETRTELLSAQQTQGRLQAEIDTMAEA